MIIAVDFDGTIVEHEYPMIGEPVPYALQTLRELEKRGHKIILFTMRSGKQLDEAVQFLKNNSITLYGINENPDQRSWTTSPKPYAKFYVDDAAIGCPLVFKGHNRPYVNWLGVKDHLIDQGFLNEPQF